MKPRCLVALLAITGFGILLPCGAGQQLPADQDEIKAEVRGLLKLHANDDFAAAQGGKYRSQFFKTLAKLAERQKAKPEEFLNYRSGRSTRSRESWGALTDGV